MIQSNFAKLVEIYPLVKLTNNLPFAHDFDYFSAGTSKKIIIDEIGKPIVDELFNELEKYWGHSNFQITFLPSYHITRDENFKIIEKLDLMFYYFDGEKQKVVFNIDLHITLDKVTIDNNNNNRGSMKEVYTIMQNKLKEIVGREYANS